MTRIVESTDARMFGLDYTEVQSRRQYVTRVRREIEVRRLDLRCCWLPDKSFLQVQSMRADVSTPPPSSPRHPSRPAAAGPSTPSLPSRGLSSPFQDPYQDDEQASWSREEQQVPFKYLLPY